MTAFYMFRLIGLTFWGTSRVDPSVEPKIHESPRSMTTPLIILAIPTVVLGLLLGLPFGSSTIQHWLEPVFGATIQLSGRTEEAFQLFGIDGALILASVAVASIGIAIAWRLFGVDLFGLRRNGDPETVTSISARLPFLYRASLNKWWFDELNDLLFIRIGGRIAAGIWWFDRVIVDGTVNGIGAVTILGGRELRRVQTGRVQNYALGIALGLIVMAGSYLIIAGSQH
jgi:NADH-quinone oxidoreductase subunit L